MEPRRGFTIIELAIVMAIIAILLVVGFVSFRSYQANARDKERESDVAAIQIYLESIYAQEIRDHSGNIIKEAGTYPAVVLPRSDGVNSVNRTADEWKIVFDGLSVKSLYAPGQTGDLSDGVKNLAPSGEYSASGGSAVDLSNCDSGWCYYSVATAKNCPAREPATASATSSGVGCGDNLPNTSAAITSSMVCGRLLISAVLRSCCHHTVNMISGPLSPTSNQPTAPCSNSDQIPNKNSEQLATPTNTCQVLPKRTEKRAFCARRLP